MTWSRPPPSGLRPPRWSRLAGLPGPAPHAPRTPRRAPARTSPSHMRAAAAAGPVRRDGGTCFLQHPQAGQLLTGSMILASTRSRNTSSPPAARSKPRTSWARERASSSSAHPRRGDRQRPASRSGIQALAAVAAGCSRCDLRCPRAGQARDRDGFAHSAQSRHDQRSAAGCGPSGDWSRPAGQEAGARMIVHAVATL